MKMYRFILEDETGTEFMGTDIDSPEPTIDPEFWERFMQGNCVMKLVKIYEESEAVK